MTETTPLDEWCQTCGARPGEGCVSTFGRRLPVKPHKPRVARMLHRAFPEAAPKPRSPSSRSTIPPKVRVDVLARSHGRCEVVTPACPPGPHSAFPMHHVLPRSAGGAHDAGNLLHVCLGAHDWIHAHPRASYDAGWLRRSPPPRRGPTG